MKKKCTNAFGGGAFALFCLFTFFLGTLGTSVASVPPANISLPLMPPASISTTLFYDYWALLR